MHVTSTRVRVSVLQCPAGSGKRSSWHFSELVPVAWCYPVTALVPTSTASPAAQTAAHVLQTHLHAALQRSLRTVAQLHRSVASELPPV
jgi:hypothetical protein